MHSERNRTEENMTGSEGGTSYYGGKNTNNIRPNWDNLTYDL